MECGPVECMRVKDDMGVAICVEPITLIDLCDLTC